MKKIKYKINEYVDAMNFTEMLGKERCFQPSLIDVYRVVKLFYHPENINFVTLYKTLQVYRKLLHKEAIEIH